MTAVLEAAAADPHQTIAELRRQLGECRAELAARNSEFGERIEHQAATIDVLKAMSASPGDPQPVFDLIVRRARDLCNATTAGLLEFDGELVHLRSWVGIEAYGAPEAFEAYQRLFPMVPTRGSIPCRAILDRQIIHVRDFATEPGVLAAARNLGHKSNIALPLLRDGAAIGAVVLSSGETGGYSDSQVALLQTFAEQAVIAITSAETYRELQQRTGDLQESLEYQTATSDVLKVISRSTFDLQPVLDTLVKTAARLCDAGMAGIAIRSGDLYRYVATLSFDPEWDQILRTMTFAPGRGSLPGRVALERQPVHIADLAADPEFAVPQAVTVGKVRTVLGVPLLREGEPIGVLSVLRQRVEPFTERQIELVRTFADQAVIAMENARLLGELQARTHDLEESLEYQTATSDVLKVISRSTFDLQPILDTLVETGQRLCDSDAATLSIREGDVLRYVATRSLDPAWDAFLRARTFAPGRETLVGQVALTGEVVHIPDITTDPEHHLPEAATLGKRRTVLGVPLLRDGSVVGVLGMGRGRVEPFSERQIELVRTFADQAVIAIENTRLLTELRESLEQQTATAEVLGVINSSPGDLAPVFDAILEKAHSLCGVSHGNLVIYDGEHFRAVATRGMTEAYEAVLRSPFRAGPNHERLLRGERFIHTPDVQSGPTDTLQLRATVAAGSRTMLMVPLRKDGVLLGLISAHRKEVRPFAEKEIALLENFAAQAVIAMENARLLGELRERTAELAERNTAFAERIDHQAATIDVLKQMSASPADAQPVFDLICHQAKALLGTLGVGLFEYDGELVHYRATSRSASFADPTTIAAYDARWPRVPDRGSLTCRAILDGTILHVRDMDAEPDVSPEVRALGYKTQVSIPLMREGRAIGAITTSSPRVDGISDTQIELLKTFAEQAVIAIQSAETWRELQACTRDLEESLEYQTATSDVLKVISRSTFDLQPVLDTVCETAARLCEADGGAISIREGEGRRVVATFSLTSEWDAFMRGRLFPLDRGTVTGRTMLGGHVVHVHDVASDPEYSMTETTVTLGRNRTALGVPLLREGVVIGSIGLVRQRVQPFTERQIELVRTFADQAVIAIENTRLITDTREALEQQTATAEVLQVINSSPGNLAPVFDAMLEKAMRLCEAAFGTLTTFDGNQMQLAATRGVPAAFADFIRHYRPAPAGGTIAGQILAGASLVHNIDLMAEELYSAGDPVRRATVDLAGARSSLAVPLLSDDAVRGFIHIYRQEVRPFTEKQIALLQNFAAQAVIAIENARLINETQEALERQTATAEILRVISSSPTDVQPTFDAIAAAAATVCGAASGGVYRFDGSLIHFVAHYGWTADQLDAVHSVYPIRPGRGSLTARAIMTRQVAHVGDIAADPEFPQPSFVQVGFHTVLSVPMLRDGNPIGAITVTRREVELFTDQQIDLLKTFADQAVIAIENVRLFNELTERTGDLQESLEYQTATSDVLKVISQSTFDIQPVFETIVATAARLCAADTGTISIREGEVYRYVASSFSAAEPEFWAIMRQRTILPGRQSIAGRVLLEGRVVHVEDLRADPDFAWPEVVASGRRTGLGVPLLREGAVLGVISLARNRVQPYTERQIELVRTFADQAVIAMENARLLGELQARTRDLEESLEYQTATSDVLNVISRSTADVQPVLDTVIETAARLCTADTASITIREGEVYRFVASSYSAAEPEFWAKLRQRTIVPGRDSVTGRVALEGRVVHIADILADPDWAIPDAAASGRRTMLGVPLLREGAVLGTINLGRNRVLPFTERQIELVRTFADQAVIAMENARLLGELQARTRDLEESLEYQTATSDVLKVISRSTSDVQPVLDTLVETAARLCGSDTAGIAIREGEVYRYVSTTHMGAADAEYYAALRQRTIVAGRDTVTGRVALDGRFVHVADVRADPEYAVPEVVAAGRRTVLGVPLLRESEPIGIIALNRHRVEPFTERQIELVRTFADQAVIAIENARLLSELQARTDELTRSVAELQALEEVLRAVNSSLDLDTVLATIISRAAQLSQADEGTIYEFDETEEVFVPKSTFGMSAERVAALRERRVRLGETHLGRAAVERAPVHVEDVQQDPTLSGPDRGGLLEGIHAVLAVPLLREDKVVGGLVIRRRTAGGFAPSIPTLLQTFAGQAVLAIENARLFQELAARGEEARRARTAAEAALADLRRAQDRLIQAEKMASLGQLTAGIAHEIKNPLNFVNNFAGLSVELLDELKETAAPAVAQLGDDTRAEIDEIVGMLTGNLEKIAEHGRRADGIVKSMLEHSRGGTGERREVDLNNLVEEALNLAYHGARAQDQNFNIALERDFGQGITPIELVPQDVTRVLLNLIGNGFYAATRRLRDDDAPDFRPTLKVTTRDMGEAVEIRVRDNGAGIAPEIKDKLFQPFFTTKPTGEGTGLGLSISWDIVTQQHGGTIEVDSRLGEFTEFAIRLPRTRQAATTGMTA